MKVGISGGTFRRSPGALHGCAQTSNRSHTHVKYVDKSSLRKLAHSSKTGVKGLLEQIRLVERPPSLLDIFHPNKSQICIGVILKAQWVGMAGLDRRSSTYWPEKGPMHGSVVSTPMPIKLLSLASPSPHLNLNRKGGCKERTLRALTNPASLV